MVDRVISICEDLSNSVGDNFDIPVIVNARLTRTLGRVCSSISHGKRIVNRMEISKSLLETGTDESVWGVVAHEWSHYYITKTTGEAHGHDREFKRVCAMVGCANDGTTTKVEHKEGSGPTTKYSIMCENCGFIGGRARWSTTLEHISECTCKTCKESKLSIIQNW